MPTFRRTLSLCFLTFLIPLLGLACRTRFAPENQNPKSSLLPCESDMGCPPAPHSCMISACNDGRCMLINAAPNTMVPDGEQKKGDCGIFVCDGNGNLQALADAQDFPDDDENPCTDELCEDAKPVHPPLAMGEACTTAETPEGLCNGAGKCGVCLPESRQCSGNAVQACNAEGQWNESVPCPESSPLCMSASASCLSLTEKHVVQGHVSCGRFTDGSLHCRGEAAALDVDTKAFTKITGARSMAAGALHLCALLSDGSVACTGENADGELGTGDQKAPQSLPVIAAGIQNAVQVVAGDGFSCARLESGQVQCWGRNDMGQLGIGSIGKRPKNAAEREFESAQAGEGRGSPLKIIEAAQGASQVVFGPAYGCVLRSGSVRCFGERSPVIAPEIEAPPEKSPKKPAAKTPPKAPPFVKDIKDAVDIAAGATHVCAILSNRTVRCWGDNSNGQLGDGTTDTKSSPIEIKSLPPINSIVLGAGHSCALTHTNTVQCWGDGSRGQIGDGALEKRLGPTELQGTVYERSVFAGRRHSCIGHDSNALYCFGENGSAQLDDSGNSAREKPASIAW